MTGAAGCAELLPLLLTRESSFPMITVTMMTMVTTMMTMATMVTTMIMMIMMTMIQRSNDFPPAPDP